MAALVQDAVETAKEARSTSLTCWLPKQHPYVSVLQSAGFIVLRGATNLRYHPDAMSWESLAFLDRPETSIHITHGDTDMV